MPDDDNIKPPGSAPLETDIEYGDVPPAPVMVTL
jgi:hypothetical protein